MHPSAAEQWPICVRDHRSGAQAEQYVRHIITIQNIGSGSTSEFGPFSNCINLDFGARRYSLEQQGMFQPTPHIY